MLTGIDEGMPYRVDIIPLTIAGEIQARLTGRRMYALQAGYVCYRDGGRMTLDAKYGHPAVLANHRCGEPLAHLADTEHIGAITKLVQQITSHPPYGEVEEKEEDAIFSIGELLSGKIVHVYGGPVPF